MGGYDTSLQSRTQGPKNEGENKEPWDSPVLADLAEQLGRDTCSCTDLGGRPVSTQDL